MSSIDLNNPGVLRNFLLGQMKEGNGEFYEREKVVVFKDVAGNEYVVSDEFKEFLPKKKAKKVTEESPN